VRKRRTAIRAAGAAFAVFGVGAVLPIWTAWYFRPWEGLGRPAPLWEAVGRAPATWRAAGPNGFWQSQGGNLLLLALLVLLAAGIGYGVYRASTGRGQSEEARDFDEGPAGSVPDGRSGPGALSERSGRR
jgi:hypothetical protein